MCIRDSDVTVYDALEDIKSQNPLKIKNIDYFKEQGINISLISSEIDWDKQVVNSTLLYKTKEDLNEKSLRITNSFFDFKSPDNADWKRIFNSLNKLTQIEWLGNNKFNITNKYAKVTNQKIAPITLSGPRPEDFSYQLTAINSHKITGDILDTYSKDVIRGGF